MFKGKEEGGTGRRGIKERGDSTVHRDLSKNINKRFHEVLLTKFRGSLRSREDRSKGHVSANTSNPPKAFFTVRKSKAIVWNGSHLESQSFISPAI